MRCAPAGRDDLSFEVSIITKGPRKLLGRCRGLADRAPETIGQKRAADSRASFRPRGPPPAELSW